MIEKNYSLIDHTADMGIEVYGLSRRDLFHNAAIAFCDVICDRTNIQPKRAQKIEIQRNSDEEILQALLNELLYCFDTEQELYSKIEIETLTEDSLTATVYGERVDPKRHQIKTGIKAVTFHQLKVEQVGDQWVARIIFDV